MKTIILASDNKHKIMEFKEILKDYEILSLRDIGFEGQIVENGATFLDNALIKARAVTEFLKSKGQEAIVIADDSGLCVDALGGAPGVYSARFGGDHNSQKNRDRLLLELAGKDNRSAYFVCLLVVMHSSGQYDYVEGKTYGKITTEEFGRTDFGYDCLFFSTDLKKTFGEATEEEKDSVSHRGRAINMLLQKGLL